MRSLDDFERQLDPTLLAGAATAREQERTPVEGTAFPAAGTAPWSSTSGPSGG